MVRDSISALVPPKPKAPAAREVFFSLFNGDGDDEARESARSFLNEKIGETHRVLEDLPECERLADWMEEGVESVGRRYQQYLLERQAGGEPRFFTSRGHALSFLRTVAPTKLVDGAWLYGILPHWDDFRFRPLVHTYLEELGEGDPQQNHVVLYRKLLADVGCDRWDDLTDEHFIQGAVQLSMAHDAEHFLPEIIGYNLGYEQLPLHLLITAYELRELRIDPTYFSLHVTVDNSDSGHARKAVDSVSATMPKAADPDEFYRRVQAGYRLNFLGSNTQSVIDSFDIEKEMETIIRRKGVAGCQAHSDYREFDGRTVNEWLSSPADAGRMLAVLVRDGILKRGQNAERCAFWRMIKSPKGRMFGVFSDYEQQIIYEWITGPTFDRPSIQKDALSPETRHKLKCPINHLPAEIDSDFDIDVRALHDDLDTLNQEAGLARLIRLMSPATHHSVAGLEATRIFCEILK